MDNAEDQELSYKINFTSSVCLISLSGFLIKKNIKKLNQLSEEILSKGDVSYCIIDYGRLQEIGQYVDRELVQFQVSLRSKDIKIRHSGLPPAIKRDFLSVGTFKKEELRDSTAEALKEISTLSKN